MFEISGHFRNFVLRDVIYLCAFLLIAFTGVVCTFGFVGTSRAALLAIANLVRTLEAISMRMEISKKF